MDLQTHISKMFGSVRTIIINGEPWFIGKDICRALGDKNHNRSLGRVDDEDKRMEEITDSMGRKQKAIFINESGLYSLLFTIQPQNGNRSGEPNVYPIELQERIEKLRRFKHWVTSEVLSTIRKHKIYATDEMIDRMIEDPDLGIKALTALKEERAKAKLQKISSSYSQIDKSL